MNVFDEEQFKKVIDLLNKKPHTIPQLALEFGCTERTIKRWFAEIRSRGYRVVRDGCYVDAPYFIVTP